MTSFFIQLKIADYATAESTFIGPEYQKSGLPDAKHVFAINVLRASFLATSHPAQNVGNGTIIDMSVVRD